MRSAGSRCSLVAALLATTVLAGSQASAQPVTGPGFENHCTPAVPGLEELSGMAVIGDTMYAVGDSGSDDKVAVLDLQCGLERWLPVPVDPYDIEDVGSVRDALWLADVGDNGRRRDTVALTRLDVTDGTGELHRLTYPDGAHDAEALLIEPGGRPVVVTKEWFGTAGIYVPADGATLDDLPSPGPTPLVHVGTPVLDSTSNDATLAAPITGGAVSADGSVAAVRTYTDVYLFPVVDGDVVAALTSGTSVRVPIVAPQGESIAFTPDGDLIAGSEAGNAPGAPIPPLQILRGATASVQPLRPSTATTQDSGDTHMVRWLAVGSAVLAVGAAVVFGLLRIRRGSIRRR